MKSHVLSSSDFAKVKSIYDKCQNVIDNYDITDEAKYNFIFSKSISRVIFDMLNDFDYWIPDTTYGADARAFVYALGEYIEDCEII